MSNQYPPGGYNPPPGGAPPGGGGYGPPPGAPPGGMPPGGMPPGGMPPGGMPPGGMPPGGMPPGGAPPGAGGYGPPPGGPPGGPPGMVPPGGGAVMASPPGASASEKKGGCGGKGILIIGVLAVLFLLLACGGTAAAAWYFDVLGAVFGGGKSVAQKHLPDDCEIVAHMDVKGLMETPAVKKHVVPALDEAVKKDPESDKLAAFFRSAQLNPKKDLHGAVVCMKNLGGSEPDVLVVIGGNIRPGKVISALEKHADPDEFNKPTTIDGMKVIEAKDEPVMIAQADDGAILFSNQKSLLKSGRKTSSAWKKYELPLNEQMSVVMTKDAAQAMNKLAGPGNPLGNSASSLGRGEASLSLDTGKISIKFDVGSDSDAKEMADSINQLLKMAKDGPAMGGDEKEFVESVQIQAEGNVLSGTATLPKKMIEEAAEEFAEGVEEAGESL
jgi:hypothetical protein